MNNNKKLPWISKWLCMTQDQVLDKFQGIPGSFSDGINQERFVYIDGIRPDKALLVAHADTVWHWLEKGDDSKIRLQFKDNVISSAQTNDKYEITYGKKKRKLNINGVGIGADDRAGCGIVWKLRELGHSILITSGEEQGCIATMRIMRSDYWRQKINSHNFAVQFDRRGSNDIVFYDVGTDDFVKYVEKETGYLTDTGSTTDIRHLCTDICGVNMSVGYYHEHTPDEILKIDEFERTLSTAYKWLSQKNLPKFPFTYKNKYVHSYSKYAFNKGISEGIYDCGYTDEFDFSQSPITKATTSVLNSIVPEKKVSGIVRCPKCKNTMSQELWHRNHLSCSTCGESTY